MRRLPRPHGPSVSPAVWRYGLPVRGEGFTGTPYLGFGCGGDERRYRIGWRLTRPAGAGSIQFAVEAGRRESDNPESGSGPGSRPELGIGFRLTARW